MCPGTHTPFNIVPACLPALSTSVVMSLTCFDRTLPVFIYNSIVLFFFLLCVYVHVSLFSIGIVQCKCMEQTGMGNLLVSWQNLISPEKKKATWEELKRKRNVADGINDKKKVFFSNLHTVLLINPLIKGITCRCGCQAVIQSHIFSVAQSGDQRLFFNIFCYDTHFTRCISLELKNWLDWNSQGQ